jgi:hypothetical protein
LLLLIMSLIFQEDLAVGQQITTGVAPTAEHFLNEAIAREAARLVQASPANPPGVRQRNWIARHPVPVATLIGAAGGFAISCADSNDPCDGLYALVGAGAGALTGVIISAQQRKGLNTAAARQPNGDAVKRLVTKLGAGRAIVVTIGELRQARGRIQNVEADAFTLLVDGQAASVRIAYNDVVAIKAAGFGNGAKIGIVAGIIGAIVGFWLVCYGAGGCGGVS